MIAEFPLPLGERGMGEGLTNAKLLNINEITTSHFTNAPRNDRKIPPPWGRIKVGANFSVATSKTSAPILTFPHKGRNYFLIKRKLSPKGLQPLIQQSPMLLLWQKLIMLTFQNGICQNMMRMQNLQRILFIHILILI